MQQTGSSGNSASRRATRQRLESLARAGVTHLPAFSGQPGSVSSPATIQPATAAASTKAPASLPTAAGDRHQSLQVIAAEVAACNRCSALCTTRTQTVFGVGNPHARLCFLGEAPGADEDKQGEPFVGRAGQLLNRIIEACKLKREDVYILNVLKCRPPENRNPEPDEVANCRGFLDRQLAIIQPEYICCLGAVAAHTLLETDIPIGRMRQHFYEYRGIKVACTYHPAYLLRNPSARRPVWDDMKWLMAHMGVEL